ncbi:MAG: signal peptidase I [Alphaproteobacteria bacterium]|jgi:signal peptidase I|nr:signal peptidase I [Alphaproteobacteria bacterium]MBP9776819.1 signal peptidase I [Alphaproteobacteria bacterium]
MNKIDQKIDPILQKKELKKLIKLILVVGIFMAIGWWFTTYTQLLEVTSESLEGTHYLLVRKSSSINRGDIVAIQGHKPQYLEGSYLFTKRVIGFPGDQITKTKKDLSIKAKNGSFTTIYPLLDKTQEGQVLSPLSIPTVPEGYLFVVGDHIRSFDSRYKEFGLVSIDNIYGKALLKW